VGATDVLTTADEALHEGAGVCQDHAHIMIAVARSLGIPARYVSGYLWPGHQGVTLASHAWVDAYVPGPGWLSFDPANACRPSTSYVRVAIGLDYFDAPPVRGVRRGGPRDEELGVSVVIKPEPSTWGATVVGASVVSGPAPL
jgi:transglutaminase-like putative cysteine protease